MALAFCEVDHFVYGAGWSEEFSGAVGPADFDGLQMRLCAESDVETKVV